MKRLFVVASLCACLGGMAQAQMPFTLTDQNSVVNGDALGDGAGQLLSDWIVDGVDQLYDQTYYYRIGATPETPMWTIGGPQVLQFAPNIVQVSYQNNFIKWEILYSLYGGVAGSQTADLGEIVRVTNLTSEAIDFHQFEYDDFDLQADAGGDFAQYVGPSIIRQWKTLMLSMVGSVPEFTHYEIDNFPNLLNKMNDAVPDILGDFTTPNQPGDMTFAMQFDTVIGAHSSWVMSKNKRLSPVPEPASLAVLGVGILALLRRRR